MFIVVLLTLLGLVGFWEFLDGLLHLGWGIVSLFRRVPRVDD